MANLSKVSISINKPVETVWDKLMNPENLKYWLTGFISVKHISGEIGKAGSVSRLKFIERGKEIEITETALSIIPHQQCTFNMTSTSFGNETDIRLISFGCRTEMIQTVQFFPKQFMMKLLMPLIKGAMKKRMESDLICFKNFVETES